jgi:type III pantothenate kinase
MIFAIDVGNTQTVLGIFRGDKLLDEWRMTGAARHTEDEFWLYVKTFCEGLNVPVEELEGIVISSVVPRLTEMLKAMAEKYIHRDPLVIRGDMDSGIRVLYDDPSTLGADRLCNAVAAYSKFGGPTIVVDFGTATTYDVVSQEGEFLGGAIAAGIETSAIELSLRTANLPRVKLTFPPHPIGTDTVSGIQSGILYGAVDAMEGMVRRIEESVGTKCRVVATGGLSRLLSDRSASITHVEPALVLEGARLIYERNDGVKGKIQA